MSSTSEADSLPERRVASRIGAFAGYAACGPITGPLLAGVVRNARRGNWALCGLYAAAIPSTWALLALAAKAVLTAH